MDEFAAAEVSRKSQPTGVPVAVGVASTAFVPVNIRRIGLIISNPGANDLYLGWGFDPATGSGIKLPAGSAPLVLSVWSHGGLVFGPIKACSPAGAQTAVFAESLGT